MENIKKLRDSLGLYQKDVAAALGLDRTTYAKYENGLREPPLEVIRQMAAYYHVSADYLLDMKQSADVYQNIASADEKKLLELFALLNERGRGALLDTAEAYALKRDFLKAEKETPGAI